MAVTEINLDLDSSEEAIIEYLRSSPLAGKCQNEVYHTLDALKVWKDWFQARYGRLIQIKHHSNPDDPPDLEIVFEMAILGWEHTQLKPHPYGMVDDIKNKYFQDQCITIPSLSARPNSRSEIIDSMFVGNDDAWAPVIEEQKAWLNELISLVGRKISKSDCGILLVHDTSLLIAGDVENLASGLDQIIQQPSDLCIKNWIVILHSRMNHLQYSSFIIQPGKPMLKKQVDVRYS